MNSKRVGNVSEARVLAALVEQHVPVLIPFGDNEPYDLVIDYKGFKKIQIKTGRFRNGCIHYKTVSEGYNMYTKYQEEDVDIFAVHCPELNKTYFVPFEHAKGTLRLLPTKNNQSSGVVWAKEYENLPH